MRHWGGATVTDQVQGGITSAAGFVAAAERCGLRKAGDPRPDLALLLSRVPAAAAGVFTTNRVQAAPVVLCRERLRSGRARALVVNAGVANACTGPEGMADARRMAEVAAEALGVPADEVLVASTGVIGNRLPMERVEAGIRAAAGRLSPAGGAEAALAITTTDTRPKEVAVRVAVGGKQATIGAMAKGSGMIRPNMATMLCFIATDAAVAPDALGRALGHAVDRSFNMITVDGDTSTNDSVIILANGLAGNPEITVGTEDFRLFQNALEEVCVFLAKAIARDGEGATRLLEVDVHGAESAADARKAALAVAGSNLVKAAVFGADANWGRIMAALGYSGARFDPAAVEVHLGPLPLVTGGVSAGFDEALARELLSQEEVRLTVNLNAGWGRAVAWGCDLTCDYVRINGSYRS